ncbi:MAG: ABC transporter substrate-binding protein [Thermoplasmata archaeon]
MKSWIIAIILVLVIIVSFSAGYFFNTMENKTYMQNNTTMQNKTTNYTYLTVIDDLNNIVKIKEPVNRIVSLAPSCTEIAYSIGLGKYIVGDTVYDTYPPSAKNITKIGGLTNVSVEKVLSLKPNLVLAFGGIYDHKAIQQIENAGIPVLFMYPENLDGIIHDIFLLGYATNDLNNATKVINALEKFENNLNNVLHNIKNRSTVFYLGWYNPIWTAGENTFINDMIISAGGINIASFGVGYFIINPENIVNANPNWIIVSQDQESLLSQFVNNSMFSNLTAVKLKHFIILPDYYIEEPGPQLFIGIYEIFVTLYPNLANEVSPLTINEIYLSS